MSREKELAKNTAIIVFGKICTQFISFFLIPLYTAFLDTSDYGVADLIITYIALLVPVVTLQLEQATFRFLIDVRDNENEKSLLITNVFKVLWIHFIIYFLIFLLISHFININYKWFLITNVFISMFSSILMQIARGLGKINVYTYGSMISGITAVLLNVLFIAILKMNAGSILISNLIANTLCIIYLFFKLKIFTYIQLKQKISNSKMRELYNYSLPLIPNSISWWVVNVSDRTIISSILGLAYNGIYSISNKFSSIFITIYNLFNISWTETVSLHINDVDNQRFLNKMINKMFLLFSTICILIIALLPLIFNIFVKENYHDAYNYMPILLIASLFNVVVGLYSAIYVAKKETKQLAKTSTISAIINIAINLVLIKHIGLFAAAFSTLIAYLYMMITRYVDTKKYVCIKLKLTNVLLVITELIIVTTCYYINNFIMSGVSLIFVIFASLFINKDLICDIIKSGKKVIGRYLKKERRKNYEN